MSREIGKQMSVDKFLIVALGRSATAAQYASWRACQSRERSSAFVAQSKRPPPSS